MHHNNKIESLKDLNNVNLFEVEETELRKYWFMMDQKLLNVLSPFNFAYYNFYTFHELLIYPALSITQGSSAIEKVDAENHRIVDNVTGGENRVEFELIDLQSSSSSSHVCFIASPMNCTSNDLTLATRYLNAFDENVSAMNSFSIVFTVVYDFNTIKNNNTLASSSQSIYPIIPIIENLQYNHNISVILRIRHLKAHPIIQIYEASFTYCPPASFFFTSRINVIPKFT